MIPSSKPVFGNGWLVDPFIFHYLPQSSSSTCAVSPSRLPSHHLTVKYFTYSCTFQKGGQCTHPHRHIMLTVFFTAFHYISSSCSLNPNEWTDLSPCFTITLFLISKRNKSTFDKTWLWSYVISPQPKKAVHFNSISFNSNIIQILFLLQKCVCIHSWRVLGLDL